jgi:hypothetical protein
MTIWRMRIARWIRKATNTHSEYVTLIAFPLKQWLHEGSSMLHYTYIASFVVMETVYCAVRTEYFNIIRSLLLFIATPCFRRLVAGFSSRRRRVDPASVRVDLWWTE